MPEQVPPVAAVPRRSALPLFAALVGGLLLVAAVGGGIYWSRSGPGEDVGGGDEPTVNSAPAAPPAALRTASAAFTQAAVIDDPDGYTNVRSGPAASFPVITRVNRGEVFTTYPQTTEWWQVRTADSRVGYMAGSRVRILEPGASEAEARAPEPNPTLAASPAEPAAAARRGPPPPQVFADSSRRRLAPAELAGLSTAQLRLARNEIFARHGRPFLDARLREHFELYPWYRPQPGPIALNAVEQANVRLLQRAETK